MAVATVIPTPSVAPSAAACTTTPTTAVEDIKEGLASFLERLDVPYTEVPFDWDLHSACLDEAEKLNYPFYRERAPAADDVGAYLALGVNGATAYRYLKDRRLQVNIALMIAMWLYLDDWSLKEGAAAMSFTKRMIRGQEQEGQLFVSLEHAMKAQYDLYEDSVADLITASGINGISSMGMENRWSSNGEFKPRSAQFATYFRNMTAISHAYAMWVFPPDLPLEEYIELIPDIAFMINAVNDILSFYKEERNGDSLNYISLEAKRRGHSKLEAFRILVDEVLDSHQRILESIHDKDERIKESYLEFMSGYLSYHLDPRYRLKELFAMDN